MTDTDKNIIIRFVADTQQYEERVQRVNQFIAEIKNTIREMSADGQTNFKVLAKTMAEEYENMRRAAVPVKELGGMLVRDPEEMQKAEQDIRDYRIAVGIALQELQQVDKGYSDAYRTNRQLEKKSLQEIDRAQKDYVSAVKSGSKVVTKEVLEQGKYLEQLAQKVRQLSTTTGQSYNQIISSMVRSGQITQGTGNNLLALMNNAKTASGGLGNAISGLLSNAGKLVGIFTGWQILQQVRDWLTQAANSGLEFAQAMYSLGVAVNVLQRTGIDITIRDVVENIDELRDKFKVFSEKELVVGAAQLLNLVRDFGLTREQIFKLQEAITTLAIVNGRAMDDVQRTVALALSSGYTEGLQRLGVSINRVTIAAEAQRLGFSGNYMSLTEYQRAIATYNLIIQKTAKYEDDLQEYYKTAPGQIDRAKAAFTDLSSVIGTSLVNSFGDLIGQVAIYIERIKDTVKINQGLIDSEKELEAAQSNRIVWLSSILQALKNISTFWNRVGKEVLGVDLGFDKILENASNSLQNLVNIQSAFIAKLISQWEYFKAYLSGKPISLEEMYRIREQTYQELTGLEVDFSDDMRDEAIRRMQESKAIEEKRSDELEGVARELGDKVLEAEEEWLQKREDAYEKYSEKLEDIERKRLQKLADLEIQYQQKVSDLERQYQQKRQDEFRDYNDKLEDIEIWYQQSVADANDKYRQQQIEAEEDYQNKLKRLREQFLFDLEDALRERDARQVLRLIREYNLRRKQAEDEREDNLEELRRQHEEELKEIRLQRERKLHELQIEHQRRLEEIDLWRQREYEDLTVWLEREREEISIWRQRELDEAERYYNELLLDADRYRDEIISDEIDRIRTQYNLNENGMRNLYTLLEMYIGNKGYLVQLWENYIAWLGTLNLTPSGLTIPQSANTLINPLPPAQYRHASGGLFYANRPALAMFGEAGGEYAAFIPASKVGEVIGGNGSIKLQVYLSPDLEARVIDKALNEFSDVVLEIYKEYNR